MDMEGINLTLKDLLAPPPFMPWRDFADWIRMSNEHGTVWGWIRNDYIPSYKVSVQPPHPCSVCGAEG